MITKLQYEEATLLINQYQKEESLSAIKNLSCICCIKLIKPAGGILPVVSELDTGAWKDGTVAKVGFGYGSRMHDGDTYFLGICDSCMQKAIEKDIIIKNPRVP